MYEKIKAFGKKILPLDFIIKNEGFIRKILALPYRGRRFQCNICGIGLSSFVQLSNGEKLCPNCGSLGRSRRLWHLLEKEIDDSPKSMLHFSPPSCLSKRLSKFEKLDYLSTDFEGEFKALKKLDITNLDEADCQFDFIICYHILEHVKEDTKAIRELYRVLKKSGLCLIQTPFKAGAIYEDFSIRTPEERLKHFGQEDHLRIYSVAGLKKRLQQAGFEVQVLSFDSSSDDHFGLKEQEVVLFAQKAEL